MKFVLNKCYGGFGLSDWAEGQMGCSEPDRDDPEFITLVTNHGKRVSGAFAALVVVEIPDNTTDYEIDEYDGFESITYVVDGKIHHA
jgi:redox-sensitive bicupin YhaK (pirin superfamily)